MAARVVAVSSSATHSFSKSETEAIELLPGLGVLNDAHSGATVQHRSRVAIDTTKPNLRQVHLMHVELFEELALQRLVVAPGQLGENITTRGVRLLDLPRDTRLCIGSSAVVQVTGLRNPCVQLNHFLPGLMSALLDRKPDGGLVRKAGVMAVVIQGGTVCAGDTITIELPSLPHHALQPV